MTHFYNYASSKVDRSALVKGGEAGLPGWWLCCLMMACDRRWQQYPLIPSVGNQLAVMGLDGRPLLRGCTQQSE